SRRASSASPSGSSRANPPDPSTSTCGKDWGYLGAERWKTLGPPVASHRSWAALHEHLLPAMAGDLQLPEAGHFELGPALAADQVDVEILDILGLGRRLLGVEGAGRWAREGAEGRHPHAPDDVPEHQRPRDQQPDRHGATVAAASGTARSPPARTVRLATLPICA